MPCLHSLVFICRHVCTARLDTPSNKPEPHQHLVYTYTERDGEIQRHKRLASIFTCSKMERVGEEKETNGDRHDGVTEPTVFRGTEYSAIQTTVALALWLGTIHLTASLILTAFFFFPSSLSFSSAHSPSISPFPFQSPTFFVSFLLFWLKLSVDESWSFFFW